MKRLLFVLTLLFALSSFAEPPPQISLSQAHIAWVISLYDRDEAGKACKAAVLALDVERQKHQQATKQDRDALKVNKAVLALEADYAVAKAVVDKLGGSCE